MLHLRLIILCVSLYQFAAAQSALQNAREAMWLGDYQRAEEILSPLQQLEPENGKLTLALTNALLAQGKKQEALTLLDNSKELEWTVLIAHRAGLLRGVVAGDMQKQLARELRGKTRDAEYLTLLGQSYLFSGAGAETAFKYLEMAADVSEDDFQSLMNLAEAYSFHRQYGDAVTQLELAGAAGPASPLPWYRIGLIYKAARNFGLFVQLMEKAAGIAPTYAPAYRELGDYYYTERDYGKARHWYEALINMAQKSLTMEDRLQYVNILFLARDYHAAIRNANSLLEMDPDRVYLHRLLGYAYYETGENQLAIENLTRFLEKADPEKLIASDFEYLGDAWAKEGKDSLAGNFYMKAIEKQQDSPELYAKAAGLFYKTKDFDRAAAYYKLRLGYLTQATAQDYFELGRAYFSGEHYALADSAFAMIVQLRPDATTGYLWRAKSNARLEPDLEAHPEAKAEYGKAKPHFEAFIQVATASPDPSKLKKDLVDAYNYLAFYYFLMENDDQSLEYTARTLELEPENKYALELSSNLK